MLKVILPPRIGFIPPAALRVRKIQIPNFCEKAICGRARMTKSKGLLVVNRKGGEEGGGGLDATLLCLRSWRPLALFGTVSHTTSKLKTMHRRKTQKVLLQFTMLIRP